MTNNRNSDKTVLITGVANGLGKYLCEKLSKEYNIILGIDKIRKSEIDSQIIKKLRFYYNFDLNKIEEIQELVKKIIQDNQKIDILINNAGIKYFNYFEKTITTDIESVFNVNTLAPILLIKELLPIMIENRSGKIINVASNAAMQGYAKGSLYCSSKSALLKYSQSLSEEIRASGVSILTLCPSTLATDKYLEKYPKVDKKKLVSPEKIYDIIMKEINTNKNKSLLILSPVLRYKYVIKNIIRIIKFLILKNEI